MIVRGGVQGVGYRYTMRMIAREIEATGWVRNLRDGSVEAEVEGSADQVDEVLAWMAMGPPGAQVDSATVTEVSPSGDTTFQVRARLTPEPAGSPSGNGVSPCVRLLAEGPPP